MSTRAEISVLEARVNEARLALEKARVACPELKIW